MYKGHRTKILSLPVSGSRNKGPDRSSSLYLVITMLTKCFVF